MTSRKLSRVQAIKARRNGVVVEQRTGAPVKRKPCGCKDVEAIARESARIVEGRPSADQGDAGRGNPAAPDATPANGTLGTPYTLRSAAAARRPLAVGLLLDGVSDCLKGVAHLVAQQDQRRNQADRYDRDDQDVLHESLTRLVLHEPSHQLLHGSPFGNGIKLRMSGRSMRHAAGRYEPRGEMRGATTVSDPATDVGDAGIVATRNGAGAPMRDRRAR